MTRTILALVGILVAGGSVVAAEAPGAQQPVRATVKTVEGTVETRSAVGRPWTLVKVGQVLAEGADLRTGYRARCVLDMTDSLTQVDPLTVLCIGELRQEADTVRTRLFLKQGNVQAIVEKGHIRSDYSIVTPSATLSVRGPRGIRCSHSIDTRSLFGLTGPGRIGATGPPGRIGVTEAIGRQRGLSRSQRTKRTKKKPVQAIQGLADLRLQRMTDLFGGMRGVEVVAAARRNVGLPVPPGGVHGPAQLRVLGMSQGQQPQTAWQTASQTSLLAATARLADVAEQVANPKTKKPKKPKPPRNPHQ